MISRRNLAPHPPTLCYVTDRQALQATGSLGLIGRIRIAAEAGIDWIQIREKDLSARELLTLTRDAICTAEEAAGGARIIVNGRLDVAVAAGAAGVHLGRESVAASEVVRWCRGGNAPPGFLVGVSCHRIEEALEAEGAGASYVFFGPVYDTPAKRAFGPPRGVARLAAVCGAVGVPVMAIGGVTEENASAALQAGATGIAAIRLFQQSEDAASLKQSVDRLQRMQPR